MTLISMLMIIMIIMINITLMILNLKSKRSFMVVKLNQPTKLENTLAAHVTLSRFWFNLGQFNSTDDFMFFLNINGLFLNLLQK